MPGVSTEMEFDPGKRVKNNVKYGINVDGAASGFLDFSVKLKLFSLKSLFIRYTVSGYEYSTIQQVVP